MFLVWKRKITYVKIFVLIIIIIQPECIKWITSDSKGSTCIEHRIFCVRGQDAWKETEDSENQQKEVEVKKEKEKYD